MSDMPCTLCGNDHNDTYHKTDMPNPTGSFRHCITKNHQVPIESDDT